MNFEKLDTLLSNIDVLGIPNCDCAVTFKHEEVFRKTVGYTNLEKTQRASEDDCYYLYSASKVTAAVAALQLIEQGKLSLNDPVKKFFPEFGRFVKQGEGSVPAQKEATIEHLLSMQGGLNYDLARPSIVALVQQNPMASTQEIIREFIKDPLEFEPGTQFLYSMCLDTIGAIVELVSGERYSDYVKKHIAEPLGWKVCAYHPTPEIEAHMPQQYSFNLMAQATPSSQAIVPIPNINAAVFGANYDSAGAGLITRVSDYMTLMDALANDGIGRNGAQILTRATIDDMRTNRLVSKEMYEQHSVSNWNFGYGYGLGVRTMVDPRIAVGAKGEFGWDGLAGAFLLSDVENRISITFFMSIVGLLYAKQTVHNKLRDFTYEALRDELK